MKDVLGERVCRAVRVITSSSGDEHIRLDGLDKIMKEKVDWKRTRRARLLTQSRARNLKAGVAVRRLTSRTSPEKWRLGASVLEQTVPTC